MNFVRVIKNNHKVNACPKVSKSSKKPQESGGGSKKAKTIACRLFRDLERKLPASSLGRYSQEIGIFQRILEQKRNSTNKIYSIHEPPVYCIGKGKDHKKYEFGSKASIAVTKKSGIIVGAVHFSPNIYDGHTLPEMLTQTTELVGQRPNHW
ncbi:MAG: hypothetical protein ACQEQO_01145 [Thermodesulfobacteriota bacterium]